MTTLDCENPASTLKSISEIYGIAAPEIVAFLKTFDIEKYYAKNNPDDYPDCVLTAAFEKEHNVKPKPLDYVCWFHLTRTHPLNNFPEGIIPFKEALNIIWQMLFTLFKDTPHYKNLVDLKSGPINERYESRIRRPYLG